jgi:outer membrane receptor for ferrienterochelin and colicins
LSGGAGGADFNTRFVGRNAAGAQTVERLTTGDNENSGVQTSAKWTRLVGDAHTVTTGAELERRTRDEKRRTLENGSELLPTVDGQPFEATITRSAAYVQDEWEINKQWSAYVGLRHEQIRTVSDGPDSNFRSTSRVTTPLLHLNYKFDPAGRDLIRASLTRSYKAPNIEQLIARPTINADYPVSGRNFETSPDRVGNPGLKPELATGLDIAWEKYLKAGGLVSVGVFHRRISGLIRTDEPRLRDVAWSSQPRWVITQINLSRATTSGLELELKGRAGELMPSWFDPATALNLRASLSVYHSEVDDIPGPDNRLEQQQPWSANLGFDYRMKSLPLSFGGSLAFTPSYEVQQSTLQRLDTGRARTIDLFALWNVSRSDSLRLSANNFQAVDARSNTLLSNGDYSWTERRPKTWYGLNWDHKF